MIISLKKFAQTGQFGNLTLGMSREAVFAQLGKPTSKDEVMNSQGHIAYAWYEFFFDESDCLKRIQNKYIIADLPEAYDFKNDHFSIDLWLLETGKPLKFLEAKRQLQDADMVWDICDYEQGQCICFESGVEWLFANTATSFQEIYDDEGNKYVNWLKKPLENPDEFELNAIILDQKNYQSKTEDSTKKTPNSIDKITPPSPNTKQTILPQTEEDSTKKEEITKPKTEELTNPSTSITDYDKIINEDLLSASGLGKITIAIDGYAACGKSTLAKQVAQALDYLYLDSGAMYRCVTLYCLDNVVDIQDEMAVEQVLSNIDIDFRYDKQSGQSATFLNGENVEQEIRTLRVSNMVSPVAKIGSVRTFCVAEQRRLGKGKGITMEGRDIGTVVFPDAELKVFLTASIAIRTQRRYDQMKSKGIATTLKEVRQNLLERDHIDTTRTISPLRQAEDAKVLDNSDLTQEQQLEKMLEWVKELV
ncbi:MAG: (d)CMP kinase [Chitinophagales bacterium]